MSTSEHQKYSELWRLLGLRSPVALLALSHWHPGLRPVCRPYGSRLWHPRFWH